MRSGAIAIVQAIEQVRLEEHRHGDAAAFDEDAGAAARAQQPRSSSATSTPSVAVVVDADDRRAAEVRSPARVSDRAQTYSVSAESSLKTRVLVASRRVGSRTTRSGFGPVDEPRRQLRIVGRDRAGADDDGVAERAHAVQVARCSLRRSRTAIRRRASR